MRAARRWSCGRDPIRADAWRCWAPVLLMFVLGYGIIFDVEKLPYAVLDRDQTPASAATTYLQTCRVPATSIGTAADHRLRRSRPAHAQRRADAGHRDSAGFRPRSARAAPRPQVGAWIDGAMPCAGRDHAVATSQGMHLSWLADLAQRAG
ncbi:MAG: hypothetical protein MZV49_18630 [Rhodopseudomonas palustris]|nr:hypothetical protein [Rhodopseudomonas palustris]